MNGHAISTHTISYANRMIRGAAHMTKTAKGMITPKINA
jgi:hypothetical protein